MTAEIPTDWRCKKLDEVAAFRQGLQIAKVKRYTGGGENRVKLIKVMDFGSERESDEYIDIPPPSKRSVLCGRDDIIIARTGTLGLVLTDVEGVFHNNTFALDYDRNLFDKMFFYYLLTTPQVQRFIKIVSTRTSQSDLTHKEFSKLAVFVPPKDEQIQIVSILSKVDSIIRMYQDYESKLNVLRIGLMQRLLTGKIRVKL
jgi:type I restriction enzyme, S subunit